MTRKPNRRPLPQVAEALCCGDMVVTPSLRVGMLHEVSIQPFGCVVAFGTDGPIEHFSWRDLRRATMGEIIAAGLRGVGCNQAREQYEAT